MKLEPLRCALPAFQASVSTTQLREACEKARADGGRLVALWGCDETTRGAGYALHLALGLPAGLVWLTVPLEREQPRYPDLSDLFPAAIRMQRAAHDLVGIIPEGAKDLRKWLRHGAWAENAFPLRKTFQAEEKKSLEPDRYPFVQVEGEGVHEIPVGPVHAGTIEPGHFRFSIVGEKVLRLEERLGYKHKGIEKTFENLPRQQSPRLPRPRAGKLTVAFRG